MTESYPYSARNRISDAPRSVRGIPRPFPEADYSKFLSAFDSEVGSKAEPSPEEARLVERAKSYCRPLRFFPGIRNVWVCNSLSMNAADGDSDIDLFIETAPGMLWTGRIFATAYFSALGVRRHGNKTKGRFCLSFFGVEGADFWKIAIENDAYLFEWAKRLIPVGGTGAEIDGKDGSREGAPRFFARFAESFFKRLFLWKTLREYERLGKPWGIVISDEFLKFHPEDRRMEIRDAVRGKLSESPKK